MHKKNSIFQMLKYKLLHLKKKFDKKSASTITMCIYALTVLVMLLIIAGMAIRFFFGMIEMFRDEIGFAACVAIIIFIYMPKKNSIPADKHQKEVELTLEEIARSYVVMRSVIFDIVRSTSKRINVITPLYIEQIELPADEYYNLSAGNVVYYVFQLDKENPLEQYTQQELEEYTKLLKIALARAIETGKFRQIQIDKFVDKNGRVYDSIQICMLQDAGHVLLLTCCFCSEAYLKEKQQMDAEKHARNEDEVPKAEWKP